MADRLRIGMIGVGNMGQAAHLHNYVTLGDCEVAAIAEVRADLREAVAARWGIPRAYASHAELLQEEKLDGLVAAQPFSVHRTLVPELLDAGIPLLIEKPLAASLEDGRELAAIAGGRPLYLAYNKRSDPAATWAKGKIEEWQGTGECGRLKYIRITMPPGDWIRGMYRWNLWSAEETPGSYPPGDFVRFVNYYIHQVNLLRFLLGEDYRVTYADPEEVVFGARSESGVSCIIEMSPYTQEQGWEESALVAFEKGWIRIDLRCPGAINLSGAAQCSTPVGEFIPRIPDKGSMHCQAENFLNAIRGEEHPLADALTGLKDLETAAEYLALLEKGKGA